MNFDLDMIYFNSVLSSNPGVGNLFSRWARFKEKNSLQATLKAKNSFAGRSIFGIFTLKLKKKTYIRATVKLDKHKIYSTVYSQAK